MRRKLFASLVGITVFSLLAASASADVVIRGPFGGLMIVVPSSTEVRVGPGVLVGVPASQMMYYPPHLLGKAADEPEIVSKPLPVIRPVPDTEILPLPKVLPGGKTPAPVLATKASPISPSDFVKNFKPAAGAGNYDVLFLHPVSQKPVNVKFDLPAGKPRVSFRANSLVFDYGRREVEIRFQPKGQVQVTSR
jgi:hypothetical protein